MQLKVCNLYYNTNLILYKLLLNFTAGEVSNLKLMMPEHVFMNDDIHGQCVSDVSAHFLIRATNAHGHRCNFKIEKQRRDIVQGTNTLHCTDFVVKNVTATCEYTCAFAGLKVKKQVAVTGMHICVCKLLQKAL